MRNTTPPMTRMRSWILPICFTNPAAKDRSVSASVSQAELANRTSISRAAWTAGPDGHLHHVPSHHALAQHPSFVEVVGP